MKSPVKLPRKLTLLAWLLCFGIASQAQELSFHADPLRSHVDFVLSDVLHTVRGTFRLKDSTVQLDPTTGKASGAIVVDATSGDTGNQSRDHKMNHDVLESAKYPEFRFTLQTMQGTVPSAGSSTITLSGILRVHGADHPLTVTVPVQITNGQAMADVQFAVPYVQWGMKDPSTFVLRVGKQVDITVHLVGSVAPRPAS
jgi:polyisoprenoid-binding protein YceI